MAEISKQALQVANNTDFPNNNTGYITPAILRSFNTDMIDSTVNQAVYTSNSSSWNSSITQLNSFTSSQQPTFNNLNAFTASQLSINSGYNSATSSFNTSISGLQSQTAQLSAFTGSVNEIRFNNGTPQYSKRLNFGGFISASFVSNVNGLIADINVLQDPTKLNTSSFNDYTASTAATQSVFSASVATSISSSAYLFNQYTASTNTWTASAKVSISELQSWSSSLDTTYATDAQLASATGSLINSIATKLNTSSFNDYTASQGSSNANTNLFTASINSYTASNNTKWTTIGLLTGSYATTGSNVFTGSQIITGSVLGNIVDLTITSQTASMDLSKGNFFTLTLVSGSSTQLTATNIKAGQTINLLITQSTPASGSLTYNSTFKFPNGVSYTQTNIAGAKDILSFITFDNSTIYATPVNNLV